MTTATSTSTDATRVAGLFHALGDPTRLAIVLRLARGERCVCDLQDLLDAGQSRLSYHLKTLKDAGLVSDRREGRWIYYSLVPELLGELAEFVGDLGAGRVQGLVPLTRGELLACPPAPGADDACCG